MLKESFATLQNFSYMYRLPQKENKRKKNLKHHPFSKMFLNVITQKSKNPPRYIKFFCGEGEIFFKRKNEISTSGYALVLQENVPSANGSR